MSSENLDEKSFALGLEAKQLPLEPEHLDREAYNIGLQIYHGEKEVNDYYGTSMGLIGYCIFSKENKRDISRFQNGVQRNVDAVTEKYQNFLRLVGSAPQFKNHTKKLEKRVIDTYQHLKKEAESVLS